MIELCMIVSLTIGTIWLFGIALLLTEPEIPSPAQTYCPFCRYAAPFKIKKSCDTGIAVALLLLFPLIGLIYVLAVRGKYKCYCSVCNIPLGSNAVVLARARPPQTETMAIEQPLGIRADIREANEQQAPAQ